MTTPSSDEKVCPFCAETVKAAAVKCRFCHSDLPLTMEPPADTAQDLTEAAPPSAGLLEPTADFPGAEITDRQAPGTWFGVARGPLVGLLVASLLLVGGSVWLVVSGITDDNSRSDGLRIGGSGQVVSTAFRDEAMSAASTNAVAALSYSYKTLEADEAKARAVMTPDFIKEYEEVMAQASPKALKSKLTLKATVVASSLVSIEPRRAVALLFVNAVTAAEDSPKQQVNQNRVLMTMTRKDGEWIVSKIDAF